MIHKHPFLRISIAFVVGLLIGYVYPNGYTAAILVFIGLILNILQIKQAYRFHNHLSGMGLFFMLVAMGILTWITYPNPYSRHLPEAGLYRATLLEAPKEKPKTFQCIARLTSTDSIAYKMLLYIQKDSLSATLNEGDCMDLRLTRVQEQTFAYYNKQSIYSSAYIPKTHWHGVSKAQQTPLKRYANQTKKYLLNTLKAHTDSTGYALTSAITLGQKSHLSGATKQYFSTSGASHILAVSGLHVGIIFMAISLLLRPLTPIRWTLKIQQLLVITLLWGYAFLCGLPPSIVRAVTMFSIGALGVIAHQQSQSLNNVCFTAFAMLLYNPNYLFDMGFQLSFSAVIGILLYMEGKRFKVEGQKSELLHRLLTWVKEMCGVSIAAQLATLPLILYYFGSFPTYFLITNLTVVPLGTLLVYSCLILFAASPFAFARWMDYPIDFLGTSMQGITQAISHFPLSKISGISIGVVEVFLLYAVLVGFYYFYLQPSGRRLNILLGLVVVYLAFGLAALIKLASLG